MKLFDTYFSILLFTKILPIHKYIFSFFLLEFHHQKLYLHTIFISHTHQHFNFLFHPHLIKTYHTFRTSEFLYFPLETRTPTFLEHFIVILRNVFHRVQWRAVTARINEETYWTDRILPPWEIINNGLCYYRIYSWIRIFMEMNQ